MSIVRRSLIVFVMAVTVLAGAFDGCLMDCHAQAPAIAGAAAQPHCHPAPAQQAGLPSTELRAGRWQADPTCHHDHTVAAAESAVRVRFDSRPVGVAASLNSLAVPLPVSISPAAPRPAADRAGATVTLAPLRV